MLNEVIQKKIKELPNNIRHAIEKFDWTTKILHIAQDNKMQIDDIDTFKKETLLVIVGLTSAVDFEKNLIKQLGISHSFAEKLVDEANQHIFVPLQKLAFSDKKETLNQIQNDNIENEVISHEEVTDLMVNHGIELINENKRENPKNKLQDLANSLFETNDIKIKSEILTSPPINNTKTIKTSTKNKKKSLQEINKEKETSNNQKTIQEQFSMNKEAYSPYNEPIREEDLQGISRHRIDTHILEEKKDFQKIELNENEKIEEKHSLDIKNLNKINISKEEKIDVSPSKEKQISERGDFLKHIGAN